MLAGALTDCRTHHDFEDLIFSQSRRLGRTDVRARHRVGMVRNLVDQRGHRFCEPQAVECCATLCVRRLAGSFQDSLHQRVLRCCDVGHGASAVQLHVYHETGAAGERREVVM